MVGTGEGGKITREDVERALEVGALEEEVRPVQSIPFTGMRKSVAENMHASLQNAAQLTIFTEVDVTEMVSFLDLVRDEHKKDETIRVSYNDIIIPDHVPCLEAFPCHELHVGGRPDSDPS